MGARATAAIEKAFGKSAPEPLATARARKLVLLEGQMFTRRARGGPLYVRTLRPGCFVCSKKPRPNPTMVEQHDPALNVTFYALAPTCGIHVRSPIIADAFARAIAKRLVTDL